MRPRRPALAVRQLDDRVLPAAVLHYTDVDGDLVTVRTSAGTDADLAGVAQFDAAHRRLQTLDVSLFSASKTFVGSSVTITATPGPTGGDGFVNVGSISASGINLGRVTVHGDLGRIDAGDSVTAVASLAVNSMGRFGTTTQGASPSLVSHLNGAVGDWPSAATWTGRRST